MRSDCRSNWFTAPNRDPVARAVVMVNYDIQVREIEGTLTNNNGKLVMWDLGIFEVKNESESATSLNKQWSQQNEIEHHIFSQAETEL